MRRCGLDQVVCAEKRNYAEAVRMKLVSHVLQAKRFDVWSISPDASMCTALKVMARQYSPKKRKNSN